MAISGLVMFVTLPCTTITGLNGTTIGGEMALIALLGFLANIAFLIVAFLWTMRAADKDERDFVASIPAASRSDLCRALCSGVSPDERTGDDLNGRRRQRGDGGRRHLRNH